LPVGEVTEVAGGRDDDVDVLVREELGDVAAFHPSSAVDDPDTGTAEGVDDRTRLARICGTQYVEGDDRVHGRGVDVDRPVLIRHLVDLGDIGSPGAGCRMSSRSAGDEYGQA